MRSRASSVRVPTALSTKPKSKKLESLVSFLN
jgi:hypothetical protein